MVLALKNDGTIWAWGPTPKASLASRRRRAARSSDGSAGWTSASAIIEYQQITHREFHGGQTGATYSVVVSNGASAGPTTAAVTVTETIPAGLSLTSMAGIGWICSSNTCTRSDTLKRRR